MVRHAKVEDGILKIFGWEFEERTRGLSRSPVRDDGGGEDRKRLSAIYVIDELIKRRKGLRSERRQRELVSESERSELLSLCNGRSSQ